MGLDWIQLKQRAISPPIILDSKSASNFEPGRTDITFWYEEIENAYVNFDFHCVRKERL